MEKRSQISEGSFIKRLLLIFVFFTITPLALLSSVVSLVAISDNQLKVLSAQKSIFEEPEPGVRIYASIPSDNPSVYEQIISADARPEIIKEYLKANDSPLVPYSTLLVQTADKYELDFRLLAAIAQKESGLCRVIPEGSHNCWGWGIHSQGTLMFDSYEEGIEVVSKGLKENYIDLGYVTVEEIMQKYAHPDSTTWAEGVSYYMMQME